MFYGIYSGRRVLITGHTGFKGSWLSTWLLVLGAEVGGFSLGVPTEPSNFAILGLKRRMRNYLGDIRNRQEFGKVLEEFKPEIIFHLAAQSLVRRSYADPTMTFETNTLGTLNVLECIRHSPSVRAAVIITSDKCYRNFEWAWGYRENDILGGEDPYSASKGCAELVAYAYINSFFKGESKLAALATARAGNVIGGGDWAADRIVPDCVRSWSRNDKVHIRRPHSTRPWQHVLEPLSGYLQLGAELYRGTPSVMGESYNFGPDATVNYPVIRLIETLAVQWPDAKWTVENPPVGQSEAGLLKLCCDKALTDLRWQAVLEFEETVRMTGEWYRKYYSQAVDDMYRLTTGQIALYAEMAKKKRLPWTE